MARILEQFKNLFVFVQYKNDELCLAIANLGKENSDRTLVSQVFKTRSEEHNPHYIKVIANLILGGLAYD